MPELLLETFRNQNNLWRLKVSLLITLNFYSCEGTYSFIGNGVGKGKKITYAEAWKGK
jgi:hypothetical protein